MPGAYSLRLRFSYGVASESRWEPRSPGGGGGGDDQSARRRAMACAGCPPQRPRSSLAPAPCATPHSPVYWTMLSLMQAVLRPGAKRGRKVAKGGRKAPEPVRNEPCEGRAKRPPPSPPSGGQGGLPAGALALS